MTEDEQKVLLLALAVERDRLRAERDDLADALAEVRRLRADIYRPALVRLEEADDAARAALDRQEQP